MKVSKTLITLGVISCVAHIILGFYGFDFYHAFIKKNATEEEITIEALTDQEREDLSQISTWIEPGPATHDIDRRFEHPSEIYNLIEEAEFNNLHHVISMTDDEIVIYDTEFGSHVTVSKDQLRYDLTEEVVTTEILYYDDATHELMIVEVDDTVTLSLKEWIFYILFFSLMSIAGTFVGTAIMKLI